MKYCLVRADLLPGEGKTRSGLRMAVQRPAMTIRVEDFILEDEDPPPTEPRPELAEEWARRMNDYPAVDK